MAGLFDTFNIAKRGLNVQQSAINTTSHNIANANTVGYSRQRAVASTTKPFGGMSRFDSTGVGQVGTGAEITSIQRIRDHFIDYQFRNENGKLANYEVRSDILSKVEDIFGEPSDKGIQTLFSEFYSSFNELAKTSDKSASRTVAIQKASALANALNNTYTQLEKASLDSQELLQTNVIDVNSYLDQINELNKIISGVSAVGQTPNDLMDKRDNLLDELSAKFGITIKKQALEAIDLKAEGFQNEKNVINNLVNSSPTDENYTRFSYVKEAILEMDTATPPAPTGNVIVQYYPLGNSQATPKTITIAAVDAATAKTLKESLEQNRILTADKNGDVTIRNTTSPYATVVLSTDPSSVTVDQINTAIFKTYKYDADTNCVDNKTVKGDIAGNQSAQNSIKNYMNNLDKIAAGLAYCVNAVQTGTTDSTNPLKDADGNNFQMIFVNSKTSTNDDGISAKNITVNQNMVHDVSLLNCSNANASGERSGDRAQVIANLNTIKMNISDIKDITNRSEFFLKVGVTLSGNIKLVGSTSGKTVDNYYKDMISVLGTDSQEATRLTSIGESQVGNLHLQRTSVSGVSLDEEMTNLIQFQHAYQANAKMISTIDELLDVVINGLKR